MSKKQVLLFLSLLFLFGCSTKKYTYHSVYETSGCSFTRKKICEKLMKDGFLLNSSSEAMFDYFKKPKIVKKSILAGDPFEDRSGEFGVATCQGYVVSEESKSCAQEKDCTKSDQLELKKSLESLGCKVQMKSAHAASWKLEDRQDWNQNTCVELIKNLSL